MRIRRIVKFLCIRRKSEPDRNKLQVTRYKIQDTRYKIQDTRYKRSLIYLISLIDLIILKKSQAPRYKIQTNYKLQISKFKIQINFKYQGA